MANLGWSYPAGCSGPPEQPEPPMLAIDSENTLYDYNSSTTAYIDPGLLSIDSDDVCDLILEKYPDHEIDRTEDNPIRVYIHNGNEQCLYIEDLQKLAIKNDWFSKVSAIHESNRAKRDLLAKKFYPLH